MQLNRLFLKCRMTVVLNIVLFVFLVTSCKKDDQVLKSEVSDMAIPQLPVDPTRFSIQEYKLIEKYSSGELNKRDSIYKIILSAHNLLTPAMLNSDDPIKSKLKVNDYEGQESDPDAANIYGIADDFASQDENSVSEVYADDYIYFGDDDLDNFVRPIKTYRCLITCQFPQSSRRKNIVIVHVPIKYNVNGAASSEGAVTGEIIGLSLGIVDPAIGIVAHISSNGDAVIPVITGEVDGYMHETRTVVHTSDGKIMIKGGVQTAIYNAGAEVSAGVTVTSSVAQTAEYLFYVFFKVQHNNPDFIPPSVKTWAMLLIWDFNWL